MRSSRASVQEFLLIVMGLAITSLISSSASLLQDSIKNPLSESVHMGSVTQPIAEPGMAMMLLEVASCVLIGFRYLQGNLKTLDELDRMSSFLEDRRVQTGPATPPAVDESVLRRKFWLFSVGSLTQAILYGFASALFRTQFNFRIVLAIMFAVDVTYGLISAAMSRRLTVPEIQTAWESVQKTHVIWILLSLLQVFGVAVVCAGQSLYMEGVAPAAHLAIALIFFSCTIIDYILNKEYYFKDINF